MISVKKLREATAEIVFLIPEIKHSKFVFNDSELTDKLSKIKNKDEVILMTVCPSYKGFDGVDEDISGYVTYLMFFILSKINNQTQDEADVVAELQPLVQKFMLEFSQHGSQDCATFGNVDFGSVSVEPIVNKAQCCGWVITMGDSTYTDFAGFSE